jgi:hypothetical protein
MSDAQIQLLLEQQGFQVQSLRHEGSRVEARVTKDGKPMEMRVDPRSGAMVPVANEDDDDDD